MKANATTEDVKLKEQAPDSTMSEEASFAETALKLGGKSEEEVRRLGAMDRADEQVDRLFKYSTVASPAHRGVWDTEVPVDLFAYEPPPVGPQFEKVTAASKDLVRRHRESGTLFNEDKKIAKIIGEHYAYCNSMADLVQRFQNLEGKVLMYLNEAVFAGSHKIRNKLKDLIDGVRLRVEEKYKPAYWAKNILNFVLTTNENWSIPGAYITPWM